MRQHPDERAGSIFASAMALANEPGGLMQLTRAAIARHAQCAPGLVSHYFGDMHNVRSRVIYHGILSQNLSIIAQVIVNNLPAVVNISERLKTKALKSLV